MRIFFLEGWRLFLKPGSPPSRPKNKLLQFLIKILWIFFRSETFSHQNPESGYEFSFTEGLDPDRMNMDPKNWIKTVKRQNEQCTFETAQVSLSLQELQPSQMGHMVVLDMAPPLQISSLHKKANNNVLLQLFLAVFRIRIRTASRFKWFNYPQKR